MAQIDPSIALGVKPLQIEDPVNRFARQQELSVNMMKANEMQRAMQEEQEVKNFLRGADLSKPETRAQLSQFGKTGLAYGTALAAQEKAGLETKKLTGDISKQKLDETREAVKSLDFNPSDSNFKAYLEDAILKGRMTPQQAEQEFAAIAPLNTDQRRAFVKNRALTAEKLYSDQTTRRGQDITVRGQDMGRIPVGYRQTATGEIEPIPGGPTTTTLAPKEIQAREAKFPQATSALKTFESATDKLISDLEKLKNHEGLPSITGILAGRAPGITAKGREAQALYDKILARGGFQELQNMRNASPTGGALGNVSNQEGTQLRQAFAALDRTQEAGSIKNEVDNLIESLRGSKGRVREAYDMTYDYKAPATSGAAAAPAAGSNNDPLGLRK
jgi:hypothetical protein